MIIFIVGLHESVGADNMYSYTARIQCGKNTSITNNEHFIAATDIDAMNEVALILKNNIRYQGKNCKLTELISDKPNSQSSSGRSHIK